MSEVLSENVFDIVNWFRCKIPNITQMKVMKLLYYVQGISLAIYDKPAFDDDIVAWRYGPAVPSVHEKYRGCVKLPKVDSKTRKSVNVVDESTELLNVVVAVNNKFGNWSAGSLMLQTHKEAPWINTPQSSVISKSCIKKYFKAHVIA